MTPNQQTVSSNPVLKAVRLPNGSYTLVPAVETLEEAFVRHMDEEHRYQQEVEL
jgi:hypothetical protein